MTEQTFITINLQDVLSFADDIERAERLAEQEQRRALAASLDALEQGISVRTPVNQGTLRGSLAKAIHGTPARLRGEVFTPLAYGLPVEHGRKPGKWPPRAAIELWVNRKLGLRGPEARQAAFLIARAIGRRGTAGAQMFEKGFDAVEPLMIRLHDQIPERLIRSLLQ